MTKPNYNEFFQFSDLKGFLHSTIYYGNGRFFGNGLSILFSKIPKVFYFVEFVLVQIFCFASEKLIEIKNTRIYCLTVFLLAPIFFVKHIESWLCGFINYFVPILLLIFILLILKKQNGQKSKLKSFFRYFAIIILGFSEQLFIQHNAVMNLVIVITVLVVFIKKKRNIAEPILLIISNIAGCILLFGYEYYIDSTQTWTYKYQSENPGTIFSLDSIKEIISTLASNIGTYICIYLACIVVYTVLMAIILFLDKRDKNIKFKKLNIFLMFLYYPNAVLVLAIYLSDKLSREQYVAIIAVVFVLNLIGFIYSFIKAVFLKMPLKLKIMSAIVLFYSVASTTPFLIYASLESFRGFWFFYILFCLFTLIIADFAEKEYGFEFKKYLTVFSICACVVTACYIPAYAVQRQIYNYKAENYTTEYYLPTANETLVSSDFYWYYAEGNIDHEYIPYKEFKQMQEQSEN